MGKETGVALLNRLDADMRVEVLAFIDIEHDDYALLLALVLTGMVLGHEPYKTSAAWTKTWDNMVSKVATGRESLESTERLIALSTWEAMRKIDFLGPDLVNVKLREGPLSLSFALRTRLQSRLVDPALQRCRPSSMAGMLVKWLRATLAYSHAKDLLGSNKAIAEREALEHFSDGPATTPTLTLTLTLT